MENKIKIVFYNNFHVGDIFFAQPFIKNIVDNNSEKFDYYFFCNYSDFIYTSVIPDLKNIKYENYFLEIVNNIDRYNHENFVFLENEKILLINTWIGSMHHRWNHKPEILENYKDYLQECNVITYTKPYEVTLMNIYKQYNIEIKFNNDINLSFPIFPELNIDYFFDFKNRNNSKKIVFLNNYSGASGQTTSIQHSSEYIDLIQFLIDKDNIVLLPYDDDEILNFKNNNNIDNLYFMLDEFPIEKNIFASNLYYCAKIGNHCDISISFDTGRNFLYINKNFINEFINGNNNIKLHFGVDDFFFNNLTNNEFVPPNYANFKQANNCEDIKNYLSSYI